MIIDNDRDKRAAAWLESRYTAEQLADAEMRLAGRRRAYPSNIAKVLGITLPDSLKRTESAAAREKLAELRKIIAKRR